METVLFNTHDVALLITVYECLLFAFCVFTLKKGKKLSRYLLAAFLLSYAAIPLDTLINFGEEFRQVAIDFSPNIFFVFGNAYWLEPVFLLFYVRSLIYKDFRIRKKDLLYFAPFLLYLVYEADNWYLLDHQAKMAFLNGYHLSEEPTYKFLINLFRECFRTFCGVLCLIELHRYQKQIKNELADIESVDLTWLKTLVVGFLIIRVIAIFVTIGFIFTINFGITIDYRMLGLTSNWTVLFLISFLIFYSLSFTTVFQGINKEQEKSSEKPVDLSQVASIEQYMATEKPFLDHLLTLDKLSSQLHIPARTLSQIINRHFEQNFFEFVNHYRIEESKRLLLAEEHKQATMLDVMDMAGFNSKATFNTFFKKLVGETPTQYRKKHRG